MADGQNRSSLGKWTRRGFLVTAGLVGGGLALGLTLSPNRLKIASDNAATGDEVLLNTWVKITPDNRVTVLVPHSEMGQGAGTGLAQMLAEEMEADWSLVSIEQAPAEDGYTNSDLARGYIVGDGAAIPEFVYPMLDFTFLQIARPLVGQMTGGSTAIRLTGWHGMRRAGAAAREMLVAAAAMEWDADPAALVAEASLVRDPGTGREATFGSLATRAATLTPSLKPALKEPSAYRIVGQPVPRLDVPAKVDGTAVFGIDVSVPGMRYAAIRHAPVKGARAARLDDAAARAIPGVEAVVNIGHAVAVVADSYWTASQAADVLGVVWDGGIAEVSSTTIRAEQEAALSGEIESLIDEGDAASALAAAPDVMETTYEVPYLAHATMEPMNCTAHVADGRAEIWVGHQNVLHARRAAAGFLGLDVEQVTIHPTLLGGGFGRRGDMDFVLSALAIAREAGVPVKVIWSREEDMANDYYRPAILARFRAAVRDGRVAALDARYIDAKSGMPDSEAPFAFPYDVPDLTVGRAFWQSPIPVGAWRSVDFTQMGFFYESLMDELAVDAGADPLDFRLAHTSDPRWRAVLERLAELSGWRTPVQGTGRGRGVAIVASFGSIVGQVAEVVVSDAGEVRVERVVSAVDCGQVVNPDAARAQITGSVIFGLTAALYGEISVEGGRIVQASFPDYDMMRLSQVPAQEVEFIANGYPPGGLGEPGVPPVAPALANAIHAATGIRLRALPISKAGLTAAV